MSVDGLKDTITPKSDQLNADDLMTGPITVQIMGVARGNAEQPISISISGGYQPYKPCKSMRRVLITAWGDNGAAWVGKWMTLYCDPSVRFGGVQVGGVRISHISGIESDVVLMLTTSRGKRSEYRLKAIKLPASPLELLQKASEKGGHALKAAFEALPNSQEKADLWSQHGIKLKETAEQFDKGGIA